MKNKNKIEKIIKEHAMNLPFFCQYSVISDNDNKKNIQIPYGHYGTISTIPQHFYKPICRFIKLSDF